MCAQPIGDGPGPPPFSYTGPYSGGTKKLLLAECSTPNGIIMRVIPSCTPSVLGATGLPRMGTPPVGDVRVVPPCRQSARRHGTVQVPTPGVRKFR